MVDATTQTEWKCDCHAAEDHLPRLEGAKWKDNLLVRHHLQTNYQRHHLQLKN